MASGVKNQTKPLRYGDTEEAKRQANTKTSRIGRVGFDPLPGDQGGLASESGHKMRAAAAILEHEGRTKKNRLRS